MSRQRATSRSAGYVAVLHSPLRDIDQRAHGTDRLIGSPHREPARVGVKREQVRHRVGHRLVQVPQLHHELVGGVDLQAGPAQLLLGQLLAQELLELSHQPVEVLLVLCASALGVIHRFLEYEKGNVVVVGNELVRLRVYVARADRRADDGLRLKVVAPEHRTDLDSVRGADVVGEAQAERHVVVALPLALERDHAQAREHLARYRVRVVEAVDQLGGETERYQHGFPALERRPLRVSEPLREHLEEGEAPLPQPRDEHRCKGSPRVTGKHGHEAGHLFVAHVVGQVVDYPEEARHPVEQAYLDRAHDLSPILSRKACTLVLIRPMSALEPYSFSSCSTRMPLFSRSSLSWTLSTP